MLSEVFRGLDFALQGHSGSGKSAVVNMLSGLSRATSGEAYIYGLPVTDAGILQRNSLALRPSMSYSSIPVTSGAVKV